MPLYSLSDSDLILSSGYFCVDFAHSPCLTHGISTVCYIHFRCEWLCECVCMVFSYGLEFDAGLSVQVKPDQKTRWTQLCCWIMQKYFIKKKKKKSSIKEHTNVIASLKNSDFMGLFCICLEIWFITLFFIKGQIQKGQACFEL